MFGPSSKKNSDDYFGRFMSLPQYYQKGETLESTA